MNLKPIKRLVRYALDAAIWRLDNARLVYDQIVYPKKNANLGFSDHEHLLEATRWLERAQDVTKDGGVSGRYQLRGGWNPSYPETTGYIIPTFLALSDELKQDRLKERAGHCIEFLLQIQLQEGSFPGGEVHSNNIRPSVFNTAQILSGLIAWYKTTGNNQALEAARRAADWLISVQDSDGAWRKLFYLDQVTTYSAHASCWLAELDNTINEGRYLDAASRHLDWVLGQQNPETGWFDRCGFSKYDHDNNIAVTHTIAYTLWGVLASSEILKRSDGIEAVQRAAEAIARRLELSGWLPGVLGYQWKKRADYACLTGNAQMALIWFRLYRLKGDIRFLNAALKAIDLIKSAQPMTNPNPGIRGGIAGSDPIWRDYLYMAFPNWSVKFFIDALLEKKQVLSTLSQRPRSNWQIPPDVPQTLPGAAEDIPERPLKVVMYSSPGSRQVAQMVGAWSSWKFRPTIVIIEQPLKKPLTERFKKKIKEGGFNNALFGSLLKKLPKAQHDREAPYAKVIFPDAIKFCQIENIPILEVQSLDSAEGMKAVRDLKPDIAIHAGAGILRAPLLSIPTFGTLNVHMGILPYYRGMNVAEWAAFQGGPVGCTVHLISPGIDTGDILCTRVVDRSRASGIRELRRLVDKAQIALLGEVLHFIFIKGKLPPRRKQSLEEGKQFFRMHPELSGILEAELRSKSNATK